MTKPRIFRGVEELRTAAGESLGVSDWHELTQERIDAFAAATEDFNWIHVDVDRAAEESPMATTIAHGLYTLSLGPKFMFQLFGWGGELGVAVNYGYGRVRFPAPVPAGSHVRMHLTLDSVRDIKGTTEITLNESFERQGHDKPVCVAEALMRFIP